MILTMSPVLTSDPPGRAGGAASAGGAPPSPGRPPHSRKWLLLSDAGRNWLLHEGARLAASLSLSPPLSAGALYGITRQTVMELAVQNGLKVTEPNLTRYDLYNADECFLTGTGAEIMPVIKIDGRVIGTGKPGSLTQKLVEEYHALTTTSGEPI